MAKGQESKNLIMSEIQKIFPDSFIDGKDLRINIQEGNENLQIKLSLTVSKTVITTPAPAAVMADDGFPSPVGVKPAAANEPDTPPWEELNAPTEEELANVAKIKAALGL